MALPTFVAAGTSAAGVGAVVPGLPAGAQADDILVLGVETNSSQPATAPTGWTEFPDSPQDCGGAGSACLAAFWKRHDGSETDPTVADTGNHQIAAIIAVRGCVATGDPFDVTAGNVLNLGATSTTITIPGDTTTVADCLILAIGAHDIDAAGPQISGWANADLANVLERVDAGTDAGGGGGFGIATGEKATAGAFGATTATIGAATEQGRIMVALKPPVGVGAFELDAQPGTFAVTGAAAAVPAGRIVSALPGTYTLTGAAAGTLADRLLNAAAGSFTVTGLAADLVYQPTAGAFEMNAAPGGYTITGAAASPVAARLFTASPGSYTLTGSDAGVLAGRAVSVTAGAYTLTGASTGQLTTRTLAVAAGAYTLAGADAGLEAGILSAIVTAHFDQPNPAGGFDPGTANLAGGADPGSPDGAHFDQPTPTQVLA